MSLASFCCLVDFVLGFLILLLLMWGWLFFIIILFTFCNLTVQVAHRKDNVIFQCATSTISFLHGLSHFPPRRAASLLPIPKESLPNTAQAQNPSASPRAPRPPWALSPRQQRVNSPGRAAFRVMHLEALFFCYMSLCSQY